MERIELDLAVVGGGPAGSHTARVAKEANPDLGVAIFERGEKPAGNCAGGLGVPFLKYVGMEPPEEVIEAYIRNVAVGSKNEEYIMHLEDMDDRYVEWLGDDLDELGWILDRQEWDDYQLRQAEETGIWSYRQTTVNSVEQNGKNNPVGLTAIDRASGTELSILAENVVLANGPTWDLAIEAGFNEEDVVPSREHLHMGLQYHMQDPEFFEKYGDDTILIYLDQDYAPGGYTWSFPESDGYTRWGNGVPIGADKPAKEYLMKYLQHNNKIDLLETTRQTTNAMIPTARPLNSCVHGKVALVGDTGHHCDPVHGGGMLIGARAGVELGKAIANEEWDLQAYDQMWKDEVLDTLDHRFIIRDVLVNMDNEEYDRLVKAFDGFKFKNMDGDEEIPRLMWHALQNDKGIFSKTAVEATRSVVKSKIGV